MSAHPVKEPAAQVARGIGRAQLLPNTQRSVTSDNTIEHGVSQSKLIRGHLGLRSTLRHIVQTRSIQIQQNFENQTTEAILKTVSAHSTPIPSARITPTSQSIPPPVAPVPTEEGDHQGDSGSQSEKGPKIKSEENEHLASDGYKSGPAGALTAQPPTPQRQPVLYEGLYISDSEEEETERDAEQPPDSSSEDSAAPVQLLSEKAKGKQKAIDPDREPSEPTKSGSETHPDGTGARDHEDSEVWEVQQVPEDSSAGDEAEQGELEEDELLSDDVEVSEVVKGKASVRAMTREEIVGGGGIVGEQELNYRDTATDNEVGYPCLPSPTMHPDSRGSKMDDLESLFGEDPDAQPQPTRKRGRSPGDRGPPAKRSATRNVIVVDSSSGDERPVPSSSRVQKRPLSLGSASKRRDEAPRRTKPVAFGKPLAKQPITEAYENIVQKFRFNVQELRKLHNGRTQMDGTELNSKVQKILKKLPEARWWITLQDVKNSHVVELLLSIKDDHDSYGKTTVKLLFLFLNALHERFKGGTIFIWQGGKPVGFTDDYNFDF
ncbi:hypothetical protein HWV62_15801 [Athelia sp. TMB]|nr:hypothetical protein HWV62_15801 [Athelia sp. TMB]